MKNTIVLEPSTNTHTLVGEAVVVSKLPDLQGLVINNEGTSIITHGEHGVMATRCPHIIKLTQQECNPITGLLENAYD